MNVKYGQASLLECFKKQKQSQQLFLVASSFILFYSFELHFRDKEI